MGTFVVVVSFHVKAATHEFIGDTLDSLVAVSGRTALGDIVGDLALGEAENAVGKFLCRVGNLATR